MSDINAIVQLDSSKKNRGRPRKCENRKEYLKEYYKKRYQENKKEYKEKYEENKYDIKLKYEENKDDYIAKAKEVGDKYRNAYRLMKMLYTKDDIPSIYKEEIRKVCAF
jgi:hypothetical protein